MGESRRVKWRYIWRGEWRVGETLPTRTILFITRSTLGGVIIAIFASVHGYVALPSPFLGSSSTSVTAIRPIAPFFPVAVDCKLKQLRIKWIPDDSRYKLFFRYITRNKVKFFNISSSVLLQCIAITTNQDNVGCCTIYFDLLLPCIRRLRTWLLRNLVVWSDIRIRKTRSTRSIDSKVSKYRPLNKWRWMFVWLF